MRAFLPHAAGCAQVCCMPHFECFTLLAAGYLLQAARRLFLILSAAIVDDSYICFMLLVPCFCCTPYAACCILRVASCMSIEVLPCAAILGDTLHTAPCFLSLAPCIVAACSLQALYAVSCLLFAVRCSLSDARCSLHACFCHTGGRSPPVGSGVTRW